MGYKGEQCSGGRTILRTHGGKLQLARRVSPLSRSSSVVLRQFRTIGYSGELWRSVAEREGFEPPIGPDLLTCDPSYLYATATRQPYLRSRSLSCWRSLRSVA